ncbi:hypothetical protein BYT27DRAFT_7189236 [Phlegmacium glaucopus]|nr:hypothetical protein BYT27DRAFT_7189236 [Phlegmacium glaucopus]
MWYLCNIFHILIGSRTPDILCSAANSDNKSIEDLDQMQQAGSKILEKAISRELFELLIDTRLRQNENSRLPFGASQTPFDSLAGADTTRAAVKLVSLEEARSRRKAIQREKPMQRNISSNKQACCSESKYEIDATLFDRDYTGCHGSEKFENHGTELFNGMITEENTMHHVLDDAERGMLLCVVERYVNKS